MTIELKLFDNEKETSEGFPLALMIRHQKNRKRKNICFCKVNHFIADGKTISSKHPDYDGDPVYGNILFPHMLYGNANFFSSRSILGKKLWSVCNLGLMDSTVVCENKSSNSESVFH